MEDPVEALRNKLRACRASAERKMLNLGEELAEQLLQKVTARKKKKDAKNSTDGTRLKATVEKPSGHVMLSYNWDHQALVMKIRDRLVENGIEVWMDVEKMRGSLRESMAGGVEKAAIVLCFFSQKYKDSASCREELEYAADLKKTIIPVKVEADFTPSGWLGPVMAGKLYYDFTDRRQFDAKFQELLIAVREVLEKGGGDPVDGETTQTEGALSPIASASGRPLSSSDARNILSWTASDVQNFLDKAGLSGDKFETFSGELIVRLHELYTKDEDDFFTYAFSTLHLDAFQTIALAEAVERLPNT